MEETNNNTKKKQLHYKLHYVLHVRVFPHIALEMRSPTQKWLLMSNANLAAAFSRHFLPQNGVWLLALVLIN